MDVAVMAEGAGTEERAGELADELGLRMAADFDVPSLLLVVTPQRLELRWSGPGGPGAVAADFRAGRIGPNLRRATLAGSDAARTIIDATAGLGRDAFAMAEAGARVVAFERSPVVAALLEDGLRRALADPATAEAAARMEVLRGDARDLLASAGPAEVVFLDPMYPVSGREGRKAKELRLLRDLLGGDDDSGALLEPARMAASRRVVVKRPLRAPYLANERPSGSIRGTTVRYDLYGPLQRPRDP